MNGILELEHRGVTLRASHDVVMQAILDRINPRHGSIVAGDIPPVGSYWPEQHGIRAAEMKGDDSRIFDLVIPTVSGKPIQFEDVEWGCYGKEIKGTDSLREGHANTKAMAEAGSELAKKILALNHKGHTDCYLGALCENQAVFGNCAELFEKAYYWSSTQYSANTAWGQGFASGYTNGWNKYSFSRAFVIRRVYR